MSDPKSVVAAFYNAFNVNDSAAYDQILATTWVNHPADPGEPNTPEGFKRAVAQTHASFAGFVLEVKAVVAEKDLVVCRILMSGRHVADFGGWPATGHQVSFTGMDMHRVENGRIQETWHFENYDGLKP